MSDQPTHNATGYTPLDPGRVDTLNPVEVRYWCDQFHCSRDELMVTVERVGDHVAAVREHFESGSSPRD